MRTIGTKVIVREIEVPSQTETGLYLPENSDKKYKMGEVVAVGDGTEKEPMKINVGETVLFTQYAGDPVEVAGEEYRVLEQNNILVVL